MFVLNEVVDLEASCKESADNARHELNLQSGG